MFFEDGFRKYEYLLYIVFVVTMVFLFFRYLSPLVAPFLVAFILIFFAHALLSVLQKFFHIRKKSLAVIVLLFSIMLFSVLIYFLIQIIVKELGQLEELFPAVKSHIAPFLERCYNMLDGKLGLGKVEWERYMRECFSREWSNLQAKLMPGMLTSSYHFIRGAMAACGFLLITVLATILMIKEYGNILLTLERTESLRFLRSIAKGVLSYLITFVRVQGILMIIISALCSVVLAIAGIKGFLFFGILAGFLDLLPFIGTGTVLVPLSLWQFLQGDYIRMLVCLVLYVVCILVREFLEPKLIGDRVGIPPLYMLLSIFAGLKLFGIIGLIKGPLSLVIILLLWKERTCFVKKYCEEQYKKDGIGCE